MRLLSVMVLLNVSLVIPTPLMRHVIDKQKCETWFQILSLERLDDLGILISIYKYRHLLVILILIKLKKNIQN